MLPPKFIELFYNWILENNKYTEKPYSKFNFVAFLISCIFGIFSQ